MNGVALVGDLNWALDYWATLLRVPHLADQSSLLRKRINVSKKFALPPDLAHMFADANRQDVEFFELAREVVNRSKRHFQQITPPPQRAPEGCVVAKVGSPGPPRSRIKRKCTRADRRCGTKTVFMPADSEGVVCPKGVDQASMLVQVGGKYDDWFGVSQHGNQITVTRCDKHEGWSLDLQFLCCKEAR